jgi:P27 family predicted phage terminase small subunit
MRVIEGNPSRRPLPENEPQPVVPIKLADAPEYLTENAKQEWGEIGPPLHRLGLLTEIDLPVFEMYCLARGNVVAATEEMKSTTMTITTDKGNEVQNPIIGILNRSIEISLKLATEFGMTPSSRSKVTATKTEKKSKFYGLIQGGEKVG